jgi:hypothetical protein
VPDTLHDVDFMVRDSKRFADSGNWGYAQFNYDTASDNFTPLGSGAPRKRNPIVSAVLVGSRRAPPGAPTTAQVARSALAQQTSATQTHVHLRTSDRRQAAL